jgi:uncharacterized protein (TIGR00106 family)
MAILDVTVIPVGTSTPSVSQYVADIHKVLKRHEGKVKVQLTPMSTLIEGDLDDLFEVVKEIDRVCTNIRIDDRRDLKHTMERKIEAVETKIQ